MTWQCRRSAELRDRLKAAEYAPDIKARTGLPHVVAGPCRAAGGEDVPEIRLVRMKISLTVVWIGGPEHPVDGHREAVARGPEGRR